MGPELFGFQKLVVWVMPLEGGKKEGKFLLDPRVSHVVWLIYNQ